MGRCRLFVRRERHRQRAESPRSIPMLQPLLLHQSRLVGQLERSRGIVGGAGLLRRLVVSGDRLVKLLLEIEVVRRPTEDFRPRADSPRLRTDQELVGSLAASGPSVGGRPRLEDDPFSPEEWYGESKAEAELIAFSFQSKLEVTSCRPARIIGPGDRENLTFFKLVKRGIVLRILGHERRLSMVDVEDVVDQLLLQGDLPQASGEAFFCASNETLTVQELMTEAARLLKVKTKTVPLPPVVLRALAAGADLVSDATGKKLPLNRKLARQLLAPGWTCSIEKAKRVLGFHPKRSVHESLQRSAESYLAAGWL